jgi:uncharacterized membrane protein YkvA (DUF1232 family)
MTRWLLAVGVGLIATWAILVIFLVLVRPKGGLLREAIRLLPDTIRLLRALAGDRTLPRGIRVRLWLLFVYLAIPFDVIPDFIPVIGYADDAIIVCAVLRSTVRRAGIEALWRHWPGSEAGFAALSRLAGLTRASEQSASVTVRGASRRSP